MFPVQSSELGTWYEERGGTVELLGLSSPMPAFHGTTLLNTFIDFAPRLRVSHGIARSVKERDLAHVRSDDGRMAPGNNQPHHHHITTT